MKVNKIKRIEGCLGSTYVKDLLFDKEITKDFIQYLGKLGKLTFNDSFDKPFYKIIVRGKYTITGSESNNTIRLLFPNENDSEFIEEIKDYVEKYE